MKKKLKQEKAIIEVSREMFIESIYHLIHYQRILRNLEFSLDAANQKLPQIEREFVRYSIQSNVLINVCCVQDEMSKYLFRYKENQFGEQENIKSFKWISAPIRKALEKWSGIRDFRNNVLAHNLRSNKNSFRSVLLDHSLDDYNVPNSQLDLKILFKLLDSLLKPIEEIFQNEYDEACRKIDSQPTREREEQIVFLEIDKCNEILLQCQQRIERYNEKLSLELKSMKKT